MKLSCYITLNILLDVIARLPYSPPNTPSEKRYFQQLKVNKEALNHIPIDIYGLSDKLTPEIPTKNK